MLKSCLVGESPGLVGSVKIAAFDVDDTVITPKSGSKFAKNADDWKFLLKEVPASILKLSKQGYKIVIFTNQNGIQLGKTNPDDIKIKMDNVAKAIGI